MMAETQIREELFKILGDIAPEVQAEEVSGDLPLRDQIDLDSMDYLKLISGIHRRLGVNIPESDYSKLTTLEEIMKYLKERLAAQQQAGG